MSYGWQQVQMDAPLVLRLDCDRHGPSARAQRVQEHGLERKELLKLTAQRCRCVNAQRELVREHEASTCDFALELLELSRELCGIQCTDACDGKSMRPR